MTELKEVREADLSQALSDWLQAEAGEKEVVGILDEPFLGLEDFLYDAVSQGHMKLFFTKRPARAACPPLEAEGFVWPAEPLPGRIGGFFMGSTSGFFVRKGQWYRCSSDDEVYALLSDIGSRVLRLTRGFATMP